MRPKVDLRAGKVAEDDYNGGADCKRRAGTSTAIEDMDWSSMTEDYVCFTEDFDADAELSELCDEGESDAAGSGGDVRIGGKNTIGVEIEYNACQNAVGGYYECWCKRLGGTDKRIQN